MAIKFSLRLLVILTLTCLAGTMPQHALAQGSKTITGKVTDENGAPLQGASVTIKGSRVGTVTDASGVYSIKVAGSNTVIVISFLNYADKEMKVGSQSVLDVQLAKSAKSQSMDEVVVIGYGTQRKADLTGAIGSISKKDFSEGRDSPVSEDSSIFSEAASKIRASAGMRAPASISMMSPGTTFSDGISSTFPPRTTLACGRESFFKADMA